MSVNKIINPEEDDSIEIKKSDDSTSEPSVVAEQTSLLDTPEEE